MPRPRPKRRFSAADFQRFAGAAQCLCCRGEKAGDEIVCPACWARLSPARQSAALAMLRSFSADWVLRRVYTWRFRLRMPSRAPRTLGLFGRKPARPARRQGRKIQGVAA